MAWLATLQSQWRGMKRKFWNWVKNETPDEFGSERTLYLDGEISDETWYGDEITPQMFKDELNKATGDITLWINSPGGDCFAAAQIYNMPYIIVRHLVQKSNPRRTRNPKRCRRKRYRSKLVRCLINM